MMACLHKAASMVRNAQGGKMFYHTKWLETTFNPVVSFTFALTCAELSAQGSRS